MYFLLRELSSFTGSAQITQSVSCTEQTPFIVGGSIKDNVLLGRPLDPSRYTEVIRASCLEEDIKRMEKHD
jgi:ATP-binding cassette subfamily C (CFTR/MRP) protein 4